MNQKKSEAKKKYWAEKTPQERSDISKARAKKFWETHKIVKKDKLSTD